MRLNHLFFPFLAFTLCFAPIVFAQVADPTIAASASQPGSDHHYIGNGAETVSPTDGSLSFNLPIQLPPGRQMPFPFGVRYSSAEQYFLTNNGGGASLQWYLQYPSGFELNGWGYNVPSLTAGYAPFKTWVTLNGQGQNPVTHQCDASMNYVFHGFDGVQYTIPSFGAEWIDSIYSSGTTCGGGTMSGSFYGFTATASPDPPPSTGPIGTAYTITDPSGTVYTFSDGSQSAVSPNQFPPQTWGVDAGTITDKNGNRVIASGTGVMVYTDTLGRNVFSVSSLGSSSGDNISVSGLSGNIVLHWNSVPVTFPETGHDATGTVRPGYMHLGCVINSTPTTSINVVTEIDLPNSQKYTLSYEPTYGRLSKITFPDGGYVRYLWGLNSSSVSSYFAGTNSNGQALYCDYIYDTPAVMHRYVSYDGSTEVLHQQFSYTTTWDAANPYIWDSKSTTVTSTDLVTGLVSVTAYNYNPIAAPYGGPYDLLSTFGTNIPRTVPVEWTIQYQDGSGHTLKTVRKSWADPYHMTGQQVFLDNGLGTSTLNCYDANLQITDAYEYGYPSEGTAASSPSCTSSNLPPTGPLRRHAQTVYNSNLGLIHNAPSSITVYDGSGNKAKETQIWYDENPLQPSNAQTGLFSPPGPRGNPTTISQWLNSAGSLATSKYYYFDTGQLYKRVDPCGNPSCSDMPGSGPSANVTQYSYADNFAIGTGSPSGQTSAYLTQITYPNTGVAHVESFTWGFNDGLLRTHKDQNNQLTSFAYNDPLLRLTSVSYPDSGNTTYTYNDAIYNPSTPSPSITATKLGTPSPNMTTLTAFDGMGHTVRSAITSDPDCPSGDRTDTTYDGSGRVHTVSNPYCTTGDQTYGLTTYSSDALGRTTQIARPDGNTVLTTYTGRAAQVQDEGNGTQRVTRISQVDGLGYLTSACEVSTATLPVGSNPTPSACTGADGHSTDITGTGFTTTYQYNAVGDLTQVAQGTITPRTFSYDLLSHLTSAYNPESGTTSYTYDSNGNLSTKTDARNITTTYQYDFLNRNKSKTYSDGTTPSAAMTYDVPSVDGLTILNSVGRLVKAATSDGKTATVDSYDPLGRVKNQWQCTPQNCGSGYFSLNYNYDLIGDTTSFANGVGVTFGYNYNGAARLTKMTSSLNDANHPGTLLSSATYTPFGAVTSVPMGNGVIENLSYAKRGWLQSLLPTITNHADGNPATGTVTVNGSEQSVQVPNTPGTGTVTISGREQSEPCGLSPLIQAQPQTCTLYDYGTVSIIVNGFTKTVSYGRYSTTSTIASALAVAFNGDSNSPVTASAPGAVVTLTSKASGSNTNYPLSTSVVYDSSDFSKPSFAATRSGPTLTGGTSSTVFDTGSVSITVNGYLASVSYGSGSTGTSVAASLATALSGSTSVTATASGNVVTLTSIDVGLGSDYSLSATSQTNNPSQFSSPSFTPSPSGSTLNGGTGAHSFTLSYAPNGDVLSANDNVNGNWTYSYDPFNRLIGSNENNGQFIYSYVYDRYGNRWQQNGVNHPPNLSFTGNNNRIDGAQYDASGDLLNDGTHNYTYDAENRIIQVDAGATAAYLYDANGRRARKTTASGGTVDFLYDLAGQQIAEINSSGGWNRLEAYAGGRHLATYTGGTSGPMYFIHADWLGTERARTTATGAVYETCTSLPFGDWLTCSGSDVSPMHFTGKERDSESGLDNFGARYDSSAMGRFMSPDPLYIEAHRLADPQRLNLYSYARNNPVNLTDPTGLDVTLKCDTKANCAKAVADFNNRKGAQFKVEIGKDGKLQVVKGSVGKDLTKAEGALLGAVNDTKNHATINVVGNTGDASFGVHDSKGVNTVDLENLSQLDSASNKGGLNSGDALAHEALDAYYSLSMGEEAADEAAAGLYPGLYGPTGNVNALNQFGTAMIGSTYNQAITNGSGSERISLRYITPIPAIDLMGKTPQQRQDVVDEAGSRVTGVTFVPPKQQ